VFALSVKFSQLSASKYSCVTSQQSQLTISALSTCCDNGTDTRQEEIVHVALGGVSNNFVWENIDSFPASRETPCNVNGPQFDTAELDVINVFENIFILPLYSSLETKPTSMLSRKDRKASNLSHLALGFGCEKMLQWMIYAWFWHYLC
jgi:hypothetical protein